VTFRVTGQLLSEGNEILPLQGSQPFGFGHIQE